MPGILFVAIYKSMTLGVLHPDSAREPAMLAAGEYLEICELFLRQHRDSLEQLQSTMYGGKTKLRNMLEKGLEVHIQIRLRRT